MPDFQGLGVNGGYAITLPNQTPSTWDVYQHLQEQNQRRQLLAKQQQQEADAHQNALMAYLGKEINDKGFDELFNTKLGDLREKYMGMIQKNPSISMPDLGMLMQGDLTGLSQQNGAVKKIQAMVKDQSEAYKPYDKTINHQGAAQVALKNTLFNPDGTLKSAEELNNAASSGSNFVDNALDQHPRELLKATPDLNEYVKGLPSHSVSPLYDVTNSKGDRVKKQLKAELYPFQELYSEGKDKSRIGEQKVRTRFDDKDENGQPLLFPIAKKEDYDNFVSTRPGKMLMDKMFLDEMDKNAAAAKSAGVPFKPIENGSPEAEQYKRHLLYNKLDGVSPKAFDQVELQKAALQPITTNTTIVTDDGGASKKPSNVYGPLKVLHDGLNTASYDKDGTAATPYDWGKGWVTVRDLMPSLGNLKKVSNPQGGAPVKPDNILFNPTHKGTGYRVLYTVKDSKGNDTQTWFDVSKDNLDTWLRNTGRANEEDYSKADNAVDMAEGKIAPPVTPLGAATRKVKNIITRRSR